MAAGYLQEVVASSFNFIGDFGQITWNFLSLHSLFYFSLIYLINLVS